MQPKRELQGRTDRWYKDLQRPLQWNDNKDISGLAELEALVQEAYIPDAIVGGDGEQVK